MVADLSVYFDFGGSDNTPGTEQDTDALGPPRLRFKVADDATIDANDPIPIPAAGTNYSYWKQIYLYCDTAPTTQVDNIRFYWDEVQACPTGVTLKVGEQFPTKTSTVDTGYDVADAAEIMTNHSEITSSVDAETKTSASPLGPITIGEAGNIINAIGETCHYIVLQMEVASTASPGDLADMTYVYKYDEV